MKERFGFLLVGIYAWLTAVFLGGTWLDKVYANQLNGVLGASESAMVFSEVSDTLLCIGFVMVIFGIGAIAVSWRSGDGKKSIYRQPTGIFLRIFDSNLFLLDQEHTRPIVGQAPAQWNSIHPGVYWDVQILPTITEFVVENPVTHLMFPQAIIVHSPCIGAESNNIVRAGVDDNRLQKLMRVAGLPP